MPVKKKKKAKDIKVTKNFGKNTPTGVKLLILGKAIECLSAVVEQTKAECKAHRRKFGPLSNLYDPDNVVFMLDESFRQVKWLNNDEKEYLELDVADDYDEKGRLIKQPSCAIVNDVFIYIKRLAEIAMEIDMV